MGNTMFKGLRVVEVTVYVTGPLTSQALADCGAETIQIQTGSRRPAMAAGGRPGAAGGPGGAPGGAGGPPGRAGAGGAPGGGAVAEAGGPPAGMGGGLAEGFTQNSTNKMSISLNFANPKGLELTYKLLAKTDVFIENLAGHTLINRHLGYEDVKKVNPSIIYLSTCMMGQTGPYATHAASGHKLSALSGFNNMNGCPDREAGWVGTYTDFVAPRYNIMAVLAALEYRRRTGKGQFLDMSQYEGGVQFMGPAILDYNINKRIAGRHGNDNPYAAPHNAYKCRGEDRWCAIAAFSDDEWRNVCRVMDMQSLADDSMFDTLVHRKENEVYLDAMINSWTATRPAEEVMALMQAGGVSAGVVETVEDQIEYDAHLKSRHTFWEIEPADARNDMKYPDYRLSLRIRQGPALGADNDYVYKKVLGMSDAEIADLTKQGVIG